VDFALGKTNQILNTNSKNNYNNTNKFMLPRLKNINEGYEDDFDINSNKNSNYKSGKIIKMPKNLYPFVLHKNGKNNNEEVFI